LTADGVINSAAGVALTGTLKGTGTVGAVTASASGATVSPGNSVGTLNTGNFSLTNGAHLAMEIGRTTAGSSAAGDNSDHVNVTGSVTLTGADLQLSLAPGYTYAANDVFFLLINDGLATDTVTGTFASLNGVTIPLNEGSQFTFGAQQYLITYTANFEGRSFTDGNDVALMAIPEPGSAISLLGGLGCLLALQRFRRRA